MINDPDLLLQLQQFDEIFLPLTFGQKGDFENTGFMRKSTPTTQEPGETSSTTEEQEPMPIICDASEFSYSLGKVLGTADEQQQQQQQQNKQ